MAVLLAVRTAYHFLRWRSSASAFLASGLCRASAVRELLKRGLLAEGFDTAEDGSRSKDFGLGSIAAE
jgi:hypothetical protein